MLRHVLFACSLTLVSGLCLAPANADGIESAGTDVAIALLLVAGGVTLAHDEDWLGVAQLSVDTIATVGTVYALKHLAREQRPDHSDFQSFPSDTAALAFAPAAYLWDRYGWQYGAPAYAAAAFVGYSRVESKQHHWYDVLASAGIAWGYSQVFTTQYRPRGLQSSLTATPDGAFVHMSYNF